MKRYVSLFLCLLLLLSLFGCGKHGEKDTEPEPIPVQEVTALVYNNGSTTLRFSHDESGWHWVDDTSFPLDENYVIQLLEQLTVISTQAPVASPDDISEYGLDAPTRYLTVTCGEEDTIFYFAMPSDSETWYVHLSDSNDVLAVPGEFMSLMEQGICDMALLPSLPVLDQNNVTSVSIAAGESDPFLLHYADGTWTANGKDVTDKAGSLMESLSALTLERCVDYHPTDGAMEICGLDASGWVLDVSYVNSVENEDHFVLHIGSTVPASESRFVTIDEDSTIYQMAPSSLNGILSLAESIQ